ncbi:MAG: CotH kinase family protein [Bacteroidetes bacterium]|nr:CotH kinase family protein [Bacteroidota bacterium]
MRSIFITLISLHFTFMAFSGVELTSSNLPIIIINTNGVEIPDEPKITATMGIINNSGGARNNITDPFNEYNGAIGIEVRGQSSQMFPMKSYSIELRDANGESTDQSIFGMPEESDWVLYAPYTDKTLMRNFLAYTISNSLGHWAAHCRFVEVVLNGNYIGIYVFMEKIKRDKGRVNISKMGDDDNSGDAVTGGYIFSIDKDADAWFSSFPPLNEPNASIRFSYVYPKLKDITYDQSVYIKSYVDSFENSLSGTHFQDSVIGFRKYADESSFIDYFIVNEVSRNIDAYRISSYFHKDKNSVNSKIIAGPVWDYDLAFRNADYCSGSDTTGWAYQFNNVCPDDYWQVPFWWSRFMEDTAFQSQLLCRWQQVRQTVLSEKNIFHIIDSIAALTSEARERHFEQWKVLGEYIWPNPQPIPKTYDEEMTTLKNWLHGRLLWIDNNLKQVGQCSKPVVNNDNFFDLQIVPNPVTTQFNLNITVKTATTAQILICDAAGRKIGLITQQLLTGKNSIKNNTQSWAHGVYFIKVNLADGSTKSIKLLK